MQGHLTDFFKKRRTKGHVKYFAGLEQFEKLVIEIKRQADKSQLTNAFNSLVDDLSKNKSLLKIVDLLKKALKENIPLQNKEGDFIKKGFNFELDKIRKR